MEPLKWLLFRAMERLADWLGGAAAASVALPGASDQPSLWVFASTLGELNASDPFLRSLHARLAGLRLVLITDRSLYTQVFAQQFPGACVFVTQGHSRDARRLAQRCPPALLIIAEIPCLPADAPCRFSYAFLRTAKRAGAAACLVNGWRYGYAPACRLDRLERALFGGDFVRGLDLACVQNRQVAAWLSERGAAPERVRVTGNIKFDALGRPDARPQTAGGASFLARLGRDRRPLLVAGCVTEYAEQQVVLDAFVLLLAARPEALLVLAPRHPEVAQHMSALAGFLAERGLAAAFRSRLGDLPLSPGLKVLVLDSIGELRDGYAAASLCYVGVDHNLLEPLACDKAVTVGPGWNPAYPSYPVYCALREAGAVLECAEIPELAGAWLAMLDDDDHGGEQRARARAAVQREQGAADRCLAALTDLLQERGP